MGKIFAVIGYLISVAAVVLGAVWLFNKLLDRKIDEEIDEEMECGCADCDCESDCDGTCECDAVEEDAGASEAAEA